MKQYLVVIISILLFGCNKESNYNKRLNGTWTPVNIRVFTPGGFSYFAENISGQLNFTLADKKSNKGNYQINLDFDYNNTHYSVADIGSYIIRENYVDRTSTTDQVYESKISYINKEDLDFEYRSGNIETLQIIAKKN